MKKNWWNKKYSKWTGRDMFKAILSITGVTTLICSIPIVGIWVKEMID